jgi:CRISPR-associated protein Csd1
MILKALADFARSDRLIGDSNSFENQPVCWAIQVRPDGTFAGLMDLRAEIVRGKKKILVGRPKSVPLMDGKRTVNVLARFLVDNAKYVLAVTDKDGPREKQRAKDCRDAYVALLRSAAAATNHPALNQVLAFLDNPTEVTKAVDALRAARAASNDLITFDLPNESRFLDEVQELRSWWDETQMPTGDSGGQCLVCGKRGPTVRLHSNIKGLRDASSSGVPLVSFNKPAFENYGWSQGQNASICQDCDRAYVTALNRFLSDRAVRPSDPAKSLPAQYVYLGASVTAVYWADDPDSGVEGWAAFLANKPDQAKAILESSREGKPASANGRFHCLLLQGAEGRATVKSYTTATLAEVERAARAWLAETSTPHRDMPQHPQWKMLSELTPSGKDEKVPKAWPVALYLCSLFDLPVPNMMAHAAVTRNRADAKVTDARAALLQAWWVRKQNLRTERNSMSALDEDCKEPAYRLGRLLAVCDQIQWEAAGRKRVGRTLSDGFYGALSSRPSTAIGGLMKITKARLSQLHPGRELVQSRRLGEILPSPGELALHDRMNLKDQALFALGFYHQRAEDMKKPEHSQKEQEENDND